MSKRRSTKGQGTADSPSHRVEEEINVHAKPGRRNSFALAAYEGLPNWLRDNQFIKGSYRVHFSWKLCLKSVFRIHNETMNIWTHLIGAILFVSLLGLLFSISPYGIDRLVPATSADAHQDTGILIEYRENLRGLLHSVKDHIPSIHQVSEVLKHQAVHVQHFVEKGEEALSGVQARFHLHSHRIADLTQGIIESITSSCRTCTIQSFKEKFKFLTLNVKHISELMETTTEDFVHKAKELVGEISTVLEKVDSKVLETILPDHLNVYNPLTFLSLIPIAVFIISAICCLSFSAIFHLFYCHSHEVSVIFQRLDYAGICFLISGTASAAIFYSTFRFCDCLLIFIVHFCDTFLRNIYMVCAASLPMLAFAMIFSETFMKPSMGSYRAAIFVAIGVSVAVPMFHFSILHRNWLDFSSYLVYGGLCYIFGAVLYAFRVPERFLPGYFDIWVG
jgi:adiponectin receptor